MCFQRLLHVGTFSVCLNVLILFTCVAQEEMLGAPVEAWTVPAMTYAVITRCCGKGVRHCHDASC